VDVIATGDDALKHIGEPGERLDAIELAALDQRVGDRPMACTGIEPANSEFFLVMVTGL
jgi:hypothetical protein